MKHLLNKICKIVYKDGEKISTLKGRVVEQDDEFISIQFDNKTFHISKKEIVKVVEGDVNG